MNCQIGDLAIIVTSDYPENVGGWVDVVERSERPGEWGCKILQPLTALDNELGSVVRIPAGTLCGVMDYALKPIRGQRSANPDPVHQLIEEHAGA